MKTKTMIYLERDQHRALRARARAEGISLAALIRRLAEAHLKDPAPLPSVKQVIQRQGRGRGKVSLVLELDRAREVEMALPGEWSIAPGTRAAIRAIPGVVEVQDV